MLSVDVDDDDHQCMMMLMGACYGEWYDFDHHHMLDYQRIIIIASCSFIQFFQFGPGRGNHWSGLWSNRYVMD